MTVEEMSLRLRPLLLYRSLSKSVQIRLEGDPFSYLPTSFLFPSSFLFRSLTLPIAHSFLPTPPLSGMRRDLFHFFFIPHLLLPSIHPSLKLKNPKINISAELQYSRRLFSPVPFHPASFSSFSQSQSHPTTSMPYPQTLPHSQSGFPMQHAPQPASSSSLAEQPLPPKTAIP